MTDTLLIFAALFAVSAAAPGADTMLMFGRALGGGARSAVPVAIGITAGKLVLLALAAAGVTAAAAALGPMFVVVKVVGAAYLVWLGLRLWRRKARAGGAVCTCRQPELRARRRRRAPAWH
jgi:threonine/homoserine/homoserine lactone efflux protein